MMEPVGVGKGGLSARKVLPAIGVEEEGKD